MQDPSVGRTVGPDWIGGDESAGGGKQNGIGLQVVTYSVRTSCFKTQFEQLESEFKMSRVRTVKRIEGG